MEKIYDLIILGGGPAGMSAGLYAMQTKLDTLLIEKETFGGQIATTSSVNNYLGLPSQTGEELSQKMHDHLVSTGIEIVQEEVTQTQLNSDIKHVFTHNNHYQCRAVIISIGTTVRRLGVDNEAKYLNHGLSYSTLKDRDKFADKVVAVVGGGNSAIEDAIYLSETAKKVYLVHRRQEFRGDPLLVEELYKIVNSTKKIELILECKPKAVLGETSVTNLILTHIPDDQDVDLAVEGIFVAIGRGADTDIIDANIARDSNGYIITNDRMETNLAGVYAVGDIRTTPLRQIVTAVADGAIASVNALTHIKNNK